MAEVTTISNDNDKPLERCDICFDETSNLIELPCMHKCCVECARKIDKCLMC